MRSLEQRNADLSLAMLIFDKLDKYPISPRILEIDMGIPWMKMRSLMEKLWTTRLVSKRRLRKDGYYGWYITAGEKPDEKAIKEELDYLETKKRWPIRYKEGADIVRDKMTKRECRSCGEYLPESRYFKCYECEPALAQQDDDFLFHGVGSSRVMDDFHLEDSGEDLFEQDIAELAKSTPKEDIDD